jgi:uncharacterized phage protein (TIGR02218 family)
MAEFLDRDLATVALCWRLERRDGVALGFTTHDRDLVFGGMVYRSAPGMLPSAVSVSDGFDADNVDVQGALTSDAIRAEDLRAGRWDGASVAIFMTDWETPGAEIVPVARGTLGEVSVKGAAFEAELKGPSALLERAAVEQTSPECRASLGDKRCRVDMAGRVRLARVVSAEEQTIEVEFVESPHPNPSPEGEGLYAYGRLRWIGGRNSGLESAVRASAGPTVTLHEPPVFAPAEGDLVELREGCDRSLATCAARFGNAVNFRGEPHLPGMDLLTRYPGA